MKTDHRCLLLMSRSGDWEAFYYGGNLIREAQKIDRMDLLRLWSVYGNDNVDDLVVETASARDDATISFNWAPKRLSELQDQYY